MTVTLSQVLASARARSAPLAGECAGYLVLAAADHASQGPRRIEAGSVELHPDGSVRVLGGLPSNEATTERDLRDLLDELLLVAGSVTPALLRAARRRAAVGIDGFVREIETALIPVNRSAARRALSRLERETARAVERGALVLENQRVSDRLLTPEPAGFTASPESLAQAAAPLTPAPVSSPPPPVSLPPPPISTSHPSRPASDLAPTPVAVPVRSRVTLPLPALEETPSRFETRPETVVARASRPPARASLHPAPLAEPAPAPVRASVAPCTPTPPESMTPFLGTAIARRTWTTPAATTAKAPGSPGSSWRSMREEGMSEHEAELDVPIDVEVPVDHTSTAAALEHVAEEDIVEESPDELTEPLFLEDHDGEGPLAFHDLTALMARVAPTDELAIELEESPVPASEVAPLVEMAQAVDVAPVVEGVAVEEVAVEVVAAEIVVEEAAVGEAAVDEASLEAAPAIEAVPAIEAAPVAVEPKGDEFADVELAVLLPSAEPPPVVMRKLVDPATLLPRRPLPRQSASNVEELLRSFGTDAKEGAEEQDVRSTLKRLAGLEPTPPPRDASRD